MSSITVIDNHTLLPDMADWSQGGPTWKLSWQTEEEIALRGNEGRGALRKYPRAELGFTIFPKGLAAASMHMARMRAGLAAGGKFCCPHHGRESWLAQAAAGGATELMLTPTPWPWAAGDWLLIRRADAGGGVSLHRTTAVNGYALTIDPALADGAIGWAEEGSEVFPLFFGRLLDADAAQMHGPDDAVSPIRLGGERFPIHTTAPACCAAPELTDFDYAVIRYQWTAANGTDLDTRTALLEPAFDLSVDTGSQAEMGWSRNYTGSSGGGKFPVDSERPYLQHNGDNTASGGTEAVLIDFAKIAADYPAVEQIRIRLRAFWYAVRADGGFNVQFAAYKGGVMQAQDYDFVNVGGVLTQTVNRARNAATQASADLDGEECGILIYTPATRNAAIIDP